MTALSLFLLLLAVLLGSGSTWLMLRHRLKERQEHVVQIAEELEQSRLLLNGAEERLNAAREHAERLDARLADGDGRQDALRGEVTALTAKNSELTVIAGRVSELRVENELLLAARDAQAEEAEKLKVHVAQVQAQLDEERRSAEEKLAYLRQEQETRHAESDARLLEAISKGQKQLLDAAGQVLEAKHKEGDRELENKKAAIEAQQKPILDVLTQLRGEVGGLEKANSERDGQIAQILSSLRKEQGQLVAALKKPAIRGRFGETQLRNVVEAAGLVEHCDYLQQGTQETDDGPIRPDMLVRMPSERCIIVDAKTPLSAYLEAVETEDDKGQGALLDQHARQLRDHIKKLSEKSYWSRVDGSPEFVVMFLPYDSIFQTALERDSSIFDFALQSRVLIATPMTLLAVFHAVAMGWKEERLAENAAEVCSLGRQLHDRLCTFAGHLARAGMSLDKAVENYNKAVGSFDRRVLSTARRLEELDAASDKTLPHHMGVERAVRTLPARALASGKTGEAFA